MSFEQQPAQLPHEAAPGAPGPAEQPPQVNLDDVSAVIRNGLTAEQVFVWDGLGQNEEWTI